MVAYARKQYVTTQEYLEFERKARTKHEYHDGKIVAMAGASIEHNRITFDTATHLGVQLAGSPCEGFSQDMRVRVPRCAKYYYPDVVVICGEPRFEDNVFDTLLNPLLLIEVLSDSTEHTDRRQKFDCYWTLESLTDYVMISQNEPRIEHFSRLPDGGWRYNVARGLEAVLPLPSIGCELRLAAVYARVSFPPVVPEPSEENGEEAPV